MAYTSLYLGGFYQWIWSLGIQYVISRKGWRKNQQIECHYGQHNCLTFPETRPLQKHWPRGCYPFQMLFHLCSRNSHHLYHLHHFLSLICFLHCYLRENAVLLSYTCLLKSWSFVTETRKTSHFCSSQTGCCLRKGNQSFFHNPSHNLKFWGVKFNEGLAVEHIQAL